MKAVILAGGFGTRLSEETTIRPKPMVEIGGRPILWHIMKIYSHYGINEFIVCLGYKGYFIKEYFATYFLHQSDVTLDLANNTMEILNNTSEPWKVTLIDTGVETNTAGRIKQVMPYLDETFMLTYGDGVADVDLDALLAFHRSHGKLATMTAVQPEGRFGALDLQENGQVNRFTEKPKGDGHWVNGGFFVFEPQMAPYLGDDPTVALEKAPLESLAADGELFTYRHHSFWKCMDTIRDRQQLEQMWLDAPQWKVW